MSEEFMRLDFSLGDLEKFPAGVAPFLVGTCLAINDIIIAQKIYLLSLNTTHNSEHTNEPSKEMAFSQSLVLQRSLSSKIVEYLRMVEGELTRIERSKKLAMPRFTEEAGKIIGQVCSGESYELARWYRNKATNHYSTSDIEKILRARYATDDGSEHPIYLHRMDGNSYYIMGEQILLSKLSENGQNYLETFKAFESWMLDAARNISHLHSQYCIEVLELFAPEKSMVSIEVGIGTNLRGSFATSSLPLIWNQQT